MKVAALDFGSNTTLMLICDVVDGKIMSVDCDETRITKMGQGVHESRLFHPEALARIHAALVDYKKLIDRYQPEKVFGVATSAARDVENSSELFDMAHTFGIPIEVISGAREAELTFLGAFAERSEPTQCCVIDIGGGSTEVISRQDGVIQGESVDVGSVRLMDLFGQKDPMPLEQLNAMKKYIRTRLNPKWNDLNLQAAIGVAGTPTILVCMEQEQEFQKDQIDGYILTKKQIDDWAERLQPMRLVEREKIPGLPAQRADVILAGTVILSEILGHLNMDRVEVSTYGVRYGVALHYALTP